MSLNLYTGPRYVDYFCVCFFFFGKLCYTHTHTHNYIQFNKAITSYGYLHKISHWSTCGISKLSFYEWITLHALHTKINWFCEKFLPYKKKESRFYLKCEIARGKIRVDLIVLA